MKSLVSAGYGMGILTRMGMGYSGWMEKTEKLIGSLLSGFMGLSLNIYKVTIYVGLEIASILITLNPLLPKKIVEEEYLESWLDKDNYQKPIVKMGIFFLVATFTEIQQTTNVPVRLVGENIWENI